MQSQAGRVGRLPHRLELAARLRRRRVRRRLGPRSLCLRNRHQRRARIGAASASTRSAATPASWARSRPATCSAPSFRRTSPPGRRRCARRGRGCSRSSITPMTCASSYRRPASRTRCCMPPSVGAAQASSASPIRQGPISPGNAASSRSRCQYGFAEEPGRFDHWGAGHITNFPERGHANGTVVIQPGDMWILPYIRADRERVRLEVRDGFIRKVKGSVDAKAFKYWLDRNKRSAEDIRPLRRLAPRLRPAPQCALGPDSPAWQ